MALDPAKLEDWGRLADEARAAEHLGYELRRALVEAVRVLIAEVERLQLASEVVRCLRYVTYPHCGERYATPPGDCDLVDHLEAHQALVAVGAEALPRR